MYFTLYFAHIHTPILMLVPSPYSFLFPILLLLLRYQIDRYTERRTVKRADRSYRMCVIYLSHGPPLVTLLPLCLELIHGFQIPVPEFSGNFPHPT